MTGILKLMEKNGYIYRESAKQDARLKQIIPTEKAEKIRPRFLRDQKAKPKLLGNSEGGCGTVQTGSLADV